MFSIFRISLLVCLLMISVGCQKGSEPGSDDQPSANVETAEVSTKGSESKDSDSKDKEATASEDKKEETEKPKPEPFKLPETVEGNWVLVLPQQQQMMPLYLLRVLVLEKPADADQKEKSDFEGVKLVSKSENVAPAKIVSSQTTKDTVNFVESLLDDEGGKEYIRLNFQGKLNKERGAIYGNISFNNDNCIPALLLPTIEKDLSKIKEPMPSPGAQELIQAMQSPDPFKPLDEFTQKMQMFPLAMDAYPTLLAVGLSQKKDTKTIQGIIKRYIETATLWGKRMQANSLISVGSMLARTDTDSSLATQYLDEAEKLIKEGVKPLTHWDQEMALAKARVGLKSENPEQIKAAGALLESEVKKYPHDRQLLTELVSYEKTHGSIDKAIEHLGILAGSPLSGRERQLIAVSRQNPDAVKFENPRDTLTALWKKKHGSTKGLDEYLTKSFKRFLDSFITKEAKEVDLKKGNRTSLIELFTGGSCPPCVAADLATGVVESSFPASKVIVLRYHQHVPAPDPLTNSDSESRFFFYNHSGTPSIDLNGQQVFGAAGGVEEVESSYKALLEALIPQLSATTDVKIDLSAAAKDGKLDLKANVTGTEKIKEPLRLVAVLAEDELHFESPNGINVHDMIVRSMLGEPNGFKATDGKLTLDKTLELNDFKGRISDYLSAFEEKSGANFTGAPLGLDKLHFVVFVQGELSKDVFQVASVPVTGTLTYKSEVAKPETTKPAKETKNPVKADKPQEKPAKTEEKPKAEPKPETAAKPEAAKPEAKKEAAKTEK
ncbi:hypothetical protein Pan153_57310 [Gimesia panareensis]|uniref:Thioredoxin domain-containing protein n=1 Tax=Gimesia panareensis TaxID=2527978 RepID=A0A518FXE4_9PLAN|nr:hypothetical protein [Gimesia panareensis]QDV21049.1 hypothetical protein Pan153_57310 [Gimesia panareensis]